VVDDNPTNRAICQEIFREDYNVEEARDGHEALGIVADTPPDLILLDVMMPGLDGYEVCQRLKSDPRTQHIPVIIVSAKSQTDEIIFGFESLADDYIVKPFVNKELRARVRASLRLKSAQDELQSAYRTLREHSRQIEDANERLKELDRIKAGFTAMLVHDLRSPLSVVQVSLLMLQTEEAVVNPEYRILVRESLASCNELFDLTGDLMEIFRSDSAAMMLSKSQFGLRRLIEEPHRQATILANRKEIQIDLSLDDNMPELHADLAKLQRALTNLLTNAIKFTPRRGRISLMVSGICPETGGSDITHVQIEVADSGEGIPLSDLPHIFDPYYQASTKSSGLGSGLGLAIVKRVVSAHGGEVTVRSRPEEGTRFILRLPLNYEP
jgi:two-component system sensor histidine kinase/response regulator